MAGHSEDKWTYREKEILRELYSNGTPLKEISKVLKKSVKTISAKAHRMILLRKKPVKKHDNKVVVKQVGDDVSPQEKAATQRERHAFFKSQTYTSTKDDYHPITPCDYCGAKLDETFWGRGKHCFCSEDCAIKSIGAFEDEHDFVMAAWEDMLMEEYGPGHYPEGILD